jgi:hypothetical protein
MEVLKMRKGLTRAEIIKKMPDFKKGNFDLFMARAGLKKIGFRQSKKHPHMIDYIYPADSVEKIKLVMSKI